MPNNQNNQKKYASLSTLQTFLANLRTTFTAFGHKHTISDLTDYTVDSELSASSLNPVQNKVLNEEFNAVATAMNALEAAIDTKSDSGHNHNDLYYTETEIDTKLSGKANATHSHAISEVTNLQSTLDAKVPTSRTINSKPLTENVSLSASDVGAAPASHSHDDRYYTETEIDQKLSTKSDSTHNHDSAYDVKGAAAEALTSAKNYADSAASTAANTVKNDLLNGAGEAYDTLMELGELISENTDAIDALETVAAGKADKTHAHPISDVTNLQTTLDTMNENLRNNTWYGTCSTAAATTEKVVTTASGDFRLETGSIVYVLFTYASCANATLNVDGKGAKAIKIVGNNNVSTYHWALNEVVGFAYDGTYFRVLDGQIATTTYYGVTKLSSSTSSTSTTSAATPSAVKAVYDLADSKQDPATTLSGYGITDAYTKADHEWVQIYDSGATIEQINSFANINISGYKKIMMAIKCVNDTTNASTTRYGSAIFKATNGTTYQFPVFNSMFFGSETTTASMAFFEFIDGWIVCPQVVRSIKYSDFLTSTEGGTCTNMNNMGSGLMKCTNPLSTVTISNLDQNADFFFGVGSRVIIWGCNA